MDAESPVPFWPSDTTIPAELVAGERLEIPAPVPGLSHALPPEGAARLGLLAAESLQAFEDPVYALMPERAAPGQSLLLSMGRTLGLGRFPGGERLMDDADFEVEQLRATGALAPPTPAAAAAAAKK